MRISIFGLGYVGTVNAVCLAHSGHQVYGVDTNLEKVGMVNEGKSPIIEADVERMLVDQVQNGRLHATVFPAEAISESEMSLICVGTPSTAHGATDLGQVEQVCKQIGTVLRKMDSPHTVVFRSTMLPGSTERMSSILAECSGRSLGHELHIAFNPEFLREGTAIRDFYHSPYTIIGTDDPIAATKLKEIYHFLSAPLAIMDVAEAELLKYACNAFHATKITFANEIGRVARSWGIDGAKVMDMLCRDPLLNISPAYLRPGFAFGGSCLPKDLRALAWKARLTNVRLPLLESLSWSNQLQIDQAYEIIARAVKSKKDTLGFLGLAFKPGTDDLRESPIVELVERFIGKGYRLCLYDGSVSLARLTGTNREFIDQHIPHLLDLMAEDISQLVTSCQVLVITRPCPQAMDALRCVSRDTVVLDLEHILNGQSPMPQAHKLEITRRNITGYDPTGEFAFDRAAGLEQS